MEFDYVAIGQLAQIFSPLIASAAKNIVGEVLKKGQSKENPPFGACYFNPEPDKEFWHLLQDGFNNATSVKILTTTGYTTYGGMGLDRLETVLRAKTKGELRFLLIDPTATEIIQKRVRELRGEFDFDSYKGEIERTTALLTKLRNNSGAEIQLRYFCQSPFCRIFIFDNVIAFIQPYLAGKIGDLSPAIGFKRGEDKSQFTLLDSFLEYFDKTFEFGKVVLD